MYEYIKIIEVTYLELFGIFDLLFKARLIYLDKFCSIDILEDLNNSVNLNMDGLW